MPGLSVIILALPHHPALNLLHWVCFIAMLNATHLNIVAVKLTGESCAIAGSETFTFVSIQRS